MATDLTDDERKCLQMLADGDRQYTVADMQGINRGTFKNKMVVIFDKLGAETSCQAVAMAIRRGIIQ